MVTIYPSPTGITERELPFELVLNTAGQGRVSFGNVKQIDISMLTSSGTRQVSTFGNLPDHFTVAISGGQPGSTATFIPEPATFLIMILGVIATRKGLNGKRRREVPKLPGRP